MDTRETAQRVRRGEKKVCLSPETQFKKGSIPSNKLPVGSRTVRVDKNGARRRWIKISEPNVWIPNAQHAWVSQGGTIPNGFILHHRDRDSLNDDISNLCLVTRSTHISLHRQDLQNTKPKQTKIKEKTCPDCGKKYSGRGRSIAKCVECVHIANQERKREYKRKKRNQNS